MHSIINKDSYESLKKFRENQIKTNITLHLIFLFLIIIIDLGLLVFIFIYKSKLSLLKTKSTQNTSIINSNKDKIDKNNNLLDHKFLNLVAQVLAYNYRFSYILDKSEEVLKLKNSIAKFYKEKKSKNLDINKFEIRFIFNGVSEGSTFDELRNKIDNSYNTFIIFECEKELKFGFYIEEPIYLDKKGFKYKGDDCFLMSFTNDKIFKCIGDKNKLTIKDDDNMMVFGDDDIIIKNHFFNYEEKKGIINFPFKAIDVSTINENIFTPSNEKFHIIAMEIFSFDLN